MFSSMVEDDLRRSGDTWTQVSGIPDTTGLIKVGDMASVPSIALSEWGIAHWIRNRDDGAARRLPPLHIDAVDLTKEQRLAVDNARASLISVITGGPGVGKSYLCKALASPRNRVLFLAPTGKAAQRLREATGRVAQTIHKALGYKRVTVLVDGVPRKKWVFTVKVLDADLVVADELSMIDVRLLWVLLRRIMPKCRLICVGDKDQLPPVREGAPFRDLIQCGRVPVTFLRQVHRYDIDGPIGIAAQAILAGEVPKSAVRGSAGFHRWDCGPRVAYQMAEKGYGRALQLGWKYDQIGVFCSTNADVDKLNGSLKDTFSPDNSIGNPVIQRKNYYYSTEPVFNGDQGVVIADDMYQFGNTVLRAGEGDIRPAWARTYHVSQGSQFPVVFAMANHSFLNQPMIYTGVTRCGSSGGRPSICVVIGPDRMVKEAIQRQQDPRRTLLQEFIRGEKRIENGSLRSLERDPEVE